MKKISNENITVEYTHTKKCLQSDLVIVSPGIDLKNNKVINKINNYGIPIVSEIEFGSWFTTSPIIAVTGSNGKSTVVKMLYDIFISNNMNVLLGGNIGISFSSNIYKEIKNKLKDVIHILELSSFQLQKVIDFKPKVACILNITKDHIDRHGSFNSYFRAKLNIIKNQDDNSLVVYNQDDKNPRKYFSEKLKKISQIIKFLKGKNITFTILLTNSLNMKKLNKKFRKLNKTTDVLSFPFFHSNNLKNNKKKNFYIGDIATSYEIINSRSKKK